MKESFEKFCDLEEGDHNCDSRERDGMMRNEGGGSDRDQNPKERVLESYLSLRETRVKQVITHDVCVCLCMCVCLNIHCGCDVTDGLYMQELNIIELMLLHYILCEGPVT